MPLGIQFAGRAFSEDEVLKAAYAFEQATDWHNKHPNM
jgi:aspartyl-tRNA(Asn)/glutamyl-tRNA(Gln) amidotransferase subunit A